MPSGREIAAVAATSSFLVLPLGGFGGTSGTGNTRMRGSLLAARDVGRAAPEGAGAEELKPVGALPRVKVDMTPVKSLNEMTPSKKFDPPITERTLATTGSWRYVLLQPVGALPQSCARDGAFDRPGAASCTPHRALGR
ncbi:hypothetical protein GCM10023079_10210 [Streptomyces chitinivorans]